MKSSLRIALLALSLLGAMAPGLARASGNPLYEHARQLQAQQRAPQFSIGNTVYQTVPDAKVVPDEQAAGDTAGGITAGTAGEMNTPTARGTASAAPAAVSRVGPYAIVLGNDHGNSNGNGNGANNGNGAASQARTASAAGSGGYEVAVNMKTGLPVLMLPQLQLRVREAGQGKALAQSLGGTLLFDGPTSLMVVIEFESVSAALQALPQARALDNVVQAQPTLQRRFRRPR